MEVIVLVAVFLFVVLPLLAGVALRMIGWALFGYFGTKALQRLMARREASDDDVG